MLGSVDWKVEEHASDMNSNDEGNSELCVACGDSSPAFEGTENDFNEITP